MARYFSFIWALILAASFSTDTLAQTHTLSGRVRDVNSGEYILGVNVIDTSTGKGVSTNIYGFYSLHLNSGKNTIQFSFIGYKTLIKEVLMEESHSLDINLEPTTIEIENAEVLGSRTQNTESTDLGRIDVSIETIKSLPALMGEVDILKTIQLLPGIQNAGEGNSGFYVRGGGPDQNLVLLDNATVYNASHLFGFFSVFNADAIKNVDVHKGGIPSRYGGRISSVLDIGLRDGNRKDLKCNGGIGLISSRMTVEGPIVEEKSSFIISGRRTYIDILTRPFLEGKPAEGTGYYFYDLNAKLNHRFSEKDEVFLSGYFGRDVFSFNNDNLGFGTDIPWGNAMGSFKWNHLFNDKLFLNLTTTYSDYDFAFEGSQEGFAFGFDSGIEDWNVKWQLSYYPSSRHKIKTGIDYVYHQFLPLSYKLTIDSVESQLGAEGVSDETFSHESGFYIEDEFDLNEKIKIYGGLRYSDFRHVGPFTRHHNDGTDSITIYTSGDLIKRYGGLEPRVSTRIIVGPKSSVKMGFHENYQYVHLASLTGSVMPTDVWIPSSDIVRPQWGRQYSAGYFTDLGENKDYELSVEGYYKQLENLVEYAQNTQPTDNLESNTDNNLVFGDGWSYGAEFFLKKRRGALNGWIGYTWSKTEREFPDLNNGDIFPATYDRRHDLSLVLDYTYSDRWRFGLVHVYATGNSITLPIQRYIIEGQIVDLYDDRNGFRMAPYHRVDLSATLTPQKKDAKGQWVFSIYNVYNRANPYFIFFSNEGDLNDGTLEITAKQVSLFPILPSFTWNFNF
ncbi:MAG: TonB-dependent receptor [Crocinitomicaceae bacterium]|nr:TonB-dependent receptor [Crocinitomicaceae bacterium]